MRAVTVLLVLLASFSSCHRKTAASRDAAFWAWFVAHQEDLAKVAQAGDPMTTSLTRELHDVDSRLTYELGVRTSPHELIISADGLVAAFPVVERLVAAAPAVAGWKIIAFRQRHGTSLTLSLGDGASLRGEDIAFRVLGTAERKIDVALYIKSMRTVSREAKQAAFLQLDSALGEYDVETKIGEVDIEGGNAIPSDARPFRDLPAVVDAIP